jgi:FkbM family methyltransferase
MKKTRRLIKATWRELRGSSAIDLPGGRYRLVPEAHPRSKRGEDYEMLFRLARDRSCVLDVGAKIGVTAMCMASGSGTVYAFEASERSCLILERNVRLNRLEGRIAVVNMLVGARSGRSHVYHWSAVSGRSGIVLPPRKRSAPVRKVAVALDDFVVQHELRPDLVKIDVEGAEQQVLAGMQGIMGETRPDVALELHAWPGMSAASNAERILALLEPVGYRMYWLGKRQFLDDSSVLTDMDMPQSAVETRARFLLLPKERPSPAWLESSGGKELRS